MCLVYLSYHWTRCPPGNGFFRRVWPSHPCIQISHISRGSFSPSVQFTEAASKARRLTFMISPPSETGFHPIMRGRSASTSRIWYASLFPKPCGMYQSFRAHSRNGYKVNNWHSSPSLRKETTAAGPLFLAAAMTSDRPDYRGIFTGHLDVGPNCFFFLPPTRRGL